MARRTERLDAADKIFFDRELVQTLAEQFNVKYVERKARQFVGTGELIDESKKEVRREIWDMKGRAKLAANPSDDAPQVQVTGGEDFATMKEYHLGTSYADSEIRAARLLGKPIDRMRMEAVRKGLADKLDDVITSGDTSVGNLGMLNQTACNDVTSDLNGSWLTSATAEEILEDLHTIKHKVANVTGDVEQTKRIILPTILKRHIETKARSTTSDLTILEYFKRNNPDVEIMDWERCNTAGASSKHRVVAYDPSTSNVRLLLSYEFQADPPERKGRSQKVTCWMRTGGIWLLAPKTMTYGDTL
jgi:hypothetical protein